ncbi:MAG: replicative DNA helicase, partial [candidate division WOR-3 bacterium]
QRIFRIREAGSRQGFESVHDLLMKEMENIDRALGEKRQVTGIETGFRELDLKTSGLQDGELIVVAGRPSMGKTAFALNIAVHASLRHKLPVAVFSLEMSSESLIQRLLCAEARISLQNLRRGALTPQERTRLTTALGPLGEAPIYIDDSPALTALDIRARARRLRSEHRDLGLIIVDYLQLMEVPSDRRRERNRQQEVADISRSLKAMAKELDVPVIAVSQLSREPEKRSDHRPQLSDLRESGAIEQDADLVLLLYRGEQYFPEEESLRGRAEVIIAKQRNGPLGTVQLVFEGHCMRFDNPYLLAGPEPVPEEGYDVAEFV